MNMDLDVAATRYAAWDVSELVRACRHETSMYRPRALELIEQELERRRIPPEELAKTEEIVTGAVEEELRELTGIRGELWAAILAFGGGLLSFLPELILIFLASPWPLLGWFFAFLGLYGSLVILLLLARHRAAPDHAIQWLGLSSVLGVVVWFVLGNPAELGFILFMGMMSNGFDMTYFSVSRRVQLTYHSEVVPKSAPTRELETSTRSLNPS